MILLDDKELHDSFELSERFNTMKMDKRDMSIVSESRTKIIDEVAAVAKFENIEPEKLRRLLVEGRIVIPHNPVHSPRPLGIGEGLRVKINANLGTSTDHPSLENELEKAKIAIKYGADTIMDLSTGSDISYVRKKMIENVPVPIGTVPIYQTGIEVMKKGKISDMNPDQIFKDIEQQAKDGVDFMTVHCGVNSESVAKLKKSKRLTSVVSRGGSFLISWMLQNEKENPLYEEFDKLLEIAKEYEITLSLGDGMRPGCIADASDETQIQELIVLGGLVDRARAQDVQVMIEGPGHVPLNQIEANVRIEKTVCKNAPFYVLGPLISDIAPGYDHITSAIGGALAAYYGADFLCYVTPAEHLSLPTVEDVRTGVIASKIAAHAADLAKGKDWHLDNEMSMARKALDWKKMFELALDPEKAKEVRGKIKTKLPDVCSMCSEYCALKIMTEHLL
jgi:phosphomethylpyrimidine synthase